MEVYEQTVDGDHDGDENIAGVPSMQESAFKKRKWQLQQLADKAAIKLETDRLTILKNLMFPTSPSVSIFKIITMSYL